MNYEKQSIGLPQDEVGDCSRILANFYLQDYDKQIERLVSNKGAGYLRYADDQIIAAKNEKTAKEIMFLASKELTKYGLNLNASKAKFFNRDEFYLYWSFDILKLLSKADKDKIEEAFKLFKTRIESSIPFKRDTVLRRFLTRNYNYFSDSVRKGISTLSNEKEFLTNINAYYLNRIYKLIPRGKRGEFLKKLNSLSSNILFNEFHLSIIKFVCKYKVRTTFLSKVRQNLQNLDGLTL